MSETEELTVDHSDPIAKGIRAIAERALEQTAPVVVEQAGRVLSGDRLDAAFGQLATNGTSPTTVLHSDEIVQRRPLTERRHRIQLVGAAAAVTVFVAGMAIWTTPREPMTGEAAVEAAELEQQDPGSIGDDRPESEASSGENSRWNAAPVAVLEDPLNIDLASMVDLYGQQRIESASQPVSTVQLDQLPEGWKVGHESSRLHMHPDPLTDGWVYTHTVFLEGSGHPGIDIITVGVWTGTSPHVGLDNTETLELLHSLGIGLYQQATLYDFWHNSDSVAGFVRVLTSPRSIDQASAVRGAMFADLDAIVDQVGPLNLVDRVLPGVQVPDPNIGPKRTADDVLLAGKIGPDDLDWSVSQVEGQQDLRIHIGNQPDFAFSPSSLHSWATYEAPGGQFLYGLAPTGTELVRLTAPDAEGSRVTIDLPVVQSSSYRNPIYAIPIDDRLDPEQLVFLAPDKSILGDFDLVGLPPSMMTVAD